MPKQAACEARAQSFGQPLMRVLGVNATTRASVYFYTTTDEIDALVGGLRRVGGIFGTY